jgi:hypothetical protein
MTCGLKLQIPEFSEYLEEGRFEILYNITILLTLS